MFALETEVPTPSGMTTVGRLNCGETVFGSDGRPARVVAASPVLRREAFAIGFATGEWFVVGEDQSLLVERRDGSRRAGVAHRRPAGELAAGIASHGPAAYAVRVAPQVRLPNRSLPIEPYLLGVWLAAGVPTQAAITGADEELIQCLAKVGARVFTSGIAGLHWVACSSSNRRGADLLSRLRDHELYDRKHIPTTYLRAGIDQRSALLAGLLDAGGRVSPGGEILFRTDSPAVALGMHELIASLGLRPWYRPSGDAVDLGFATTAEVFARPSYQALLQRRGPLPAEARPRRLVVAATPVGRQLVRRVQVNAEDGVLLAGRSFVPMPGAA